jgi:hypothetical protein
MSSSHIAEMLYLYGTNLCISTNYASLVILTPKSLEIKNNVRLLTAEKNNTGI